MDIKWSEGTWTNKPAGIRDDDGLLVEAVEGSDAWRQTSYGFVHDTEHALLREWPVSTAVEVDFVADFAQQFDQAGLFIAGEDSQHWVKAGIELSDGILQLGAVVTNPKSDWSVAPVPDWNGKTITIRASRTGDAVTLRARAEGGDWQFMRVFPVREQAQLKAGPMVCAPTRAGLQVRFTGWRLDEPDAGLH